MKHHEIKKERTGWISATITRPDGSEESYKNFINKEVQGSLKHEGRQCRL